MATAALKNRVIETSATTGTGTLTLAGVADPNYQRWRSGFADGSVVFYVIECRDTQQWEVGYGTLTYGASDTLSRTAVLSNSLGTTALINFGSGTKLVFSDIPAEKLVALDRDSNALTLPGAASVATNLTVGTTLTAGTGITVTAGGVTVSAGGITVTGASTITGTLSGITTLTATTFVGALTGNATTATALATARTLWGQGFDGSGNVSGSLSSVINISMSGTITGATSVTSTAFVGALTGNATTATALATGRTISITGDIAYTSGSFNGSANVTGVGTLATVNANVGSFGGSTAIPVVTVNGKGLVTAASTAAVVAPAGTLTGTTLASNVVTSSLTTIGTLVAGAVPASLVTAGTFPAGAFVFQGEISGVTTMTATTFVGALTGNATTATTLATSRTIWGQSFNGSANVSGALSGATTISATSTITGGGAVVVDAAAGSARDFRFTTSTVARWDLRANNTTESGSDAGSDFQIIARTDAGAFIDSPVTITRAASGTIAFASGRPITGGTYNGQTISSAANFTGTLTVATTLTQNGTAASLVQSSTTATLAVGTGSGAGTSALSVRSASGQLAAVTVGTGASWRWAFLKGTTTESGADAGSPLQVAAYDDFGSTIDVPITITRVAGGTITLARPVSMSSTLTITSTLTQNGATVSLAQSSSSASAVIGTGTGSSFTTLELRAAAGQTRGYDWRTGSSIRWRAQANTTAEAGSDAGSDWALNAYNDAGTFIDSPISVNRASGGSMTLTRPISHSGTTANLAQSTTSAGVNVGTGTGSSSTTLTVRAAAGQLSDFQFWSGASSRWIIRKGSTAESGSDAGSEFSLMARDDSGGLIDTVLQVVRAAGGTMTLSRPVSMSSTLAVTGAVAITASSLTVGTSTGKTTTASLVGNNLSLLMADQMTDSADKQARIGTLAYVNSQNPFVAVHQIGAAAANTLNIGGGTSLGQAATSVNLWLASAVNTTTGTAAHTFSLSSANLVQTTTTANVFLGTGTGSGDTNIVLRAAAGTNAAIGFYAGTTSRWNMRRTNATESGADAGSDFALTAYTDAGAAIDSPISIARAAGGTMSLPRPISHTAPTAMFVGSSTSANAQFGSGTGSGQSSIQIRSAAGQQSRVDLYSGSSLRWGIVKSTTAETGSDAGSPFLVNAYDDAAGFIDSPIAITRAAGGGMTLTRPINHTATVASLVQSSTTAAVIVGTGSGSSTSQIAIRSASAQQSRLDLQTGSGNRWGVVKSLDVESGADAGSNLQISAYDDTGAVIGVVLTCVRASGGTLSITRPTHISSSLTVTGAFRSSGATDGIGYTTGAGGTVTQATSKSTGVTLNKACGKITLHNAALAADTTVSFTLTNSALAAADMILMQVVGGAADSSKYVLSHTQAAGSTVITVRNVSAGSLSEAIQIGFAVIKAVQA